MTSMLRLKTAHHSFRNAPYMYSLSAVNNFLRTMSTSSTGNSRGGVHEQATSGSPMPNTKLPSPLPPSSSSSSTSSSADSRLSTEESVTKQKVTSQSLAEKDAELLAKMEGRDGGQLAVEPGQWNGLAKNVKDNMVCSHLLSLSIVALLSGLTVVLHGRAVQIYLTVDRRKVTLTLQRKLPLITAFE